jgi:hypothetical protein
MYDKRAESRAAAFGIPDRMQALENALLKIEGISDIDFDIDNYDELPHVILIPRYRVDPAREDYFQARREQRGQILEVCAAHDLYPTGDVIEDYGEHWYIVRRCGPSWPRA